MLMRSHHDEMTVHPYGEEASQHARGDVSMARSARAGAALVAALFLWVCTVGDAQALDLTVDTFGDSASTPFQACTAAGGDCTLRGAIIKANSVAGPHTITLPAGSYTLTLQGANEDAASTGDLDILQNITINGVSPATTVITWDESISTAFRDRVFHVLPAGQLTIRDMSIRQGALPTNTATYGGGVFAEGPLTAERVSIRINIAQYGGGVAVAANATIRDSAINNNNGLLGAGIGARSGASAYTVLLENTTISGNIGLDSFGGTARGGGFFQNNGNANSSIVLSNVTISNNTATIGGGMRREGGGSIVLRNTLIASNTAPTSPNCDGTFVSQGYNLVWGGDTCGLSAGNNDILNTGDPKLNALGDNGGPTAVHPLQSGSAALDKGNPATPGSGGAACAANDQRGVPRTLDGDGDGPSRCDIGAAEGGRWLRVDTTVDDPSLQTCDFNPDNSNCSLRGAITVANGAGAGQAFVITLAATGTGNPYRLTRTGAGELANATGDLNIRSDITILGGGATSTIIDGNLADRVFELQSGTARALRLHDVTIRNGNAAGAGANGMGGGIKSSAPLTLLRVRLVENRSASIGGGLYSSSNATITDSVVADNRSMSDGGGGVLQDGGASLTISNSTLARNIAQGINAFGGAIYTSFSATVVLANVTIAGNQASNGGGIYGTQTPTVRNSIIASNTASLLPNCNVQSTNSQGYNLAFGGSCGFNQGTDKNNQDPRLGPLQLNGGATETMALGMRSPAIDAGNPTAPGSGGTSCSSTDQRGLPRPTDGEGLNGARCDIGAYEAATCFNRANVAFGVAPGSPGRISVTVTAGVGNISELRLHAQPSTNIQVSIGALVNQSGELTVPINAPTAQFSIRRTSGTGSGTLPFDVVDGCGVWQTFAGGGPNAWPGGAGAGSVGQGEPPAPTDPPSQTPSPTDPRTPEPPTGAAPTPLPSCASGRPIVGMTTRKADPGQLDVVLTARSSADVPSNTLTSIRIGGSHNATIMVDGKSVATGQTVILPGGTRQVTLTLVRRAPEQDPSLASEVSFSVFDACGAWNSFAGGGPGAF